MKGCTLALAVTFATLASAAWAMDDRPQGVENDFLRLRFSPRGELQSVFDKKAGRELAAELRGQSLFRLELSELTPAATKVSLGSGEAGRVAIEQAGPNRLRLRFDELGPHKASAVCYFSTAPGDRYVRGRIEVTVPARLVLESVRFPYVVLRTPAGADAADALVLGTTKGGVYRCPSQWKTGKAASGRQPGNLTAQFGCYYEPLGGLATMSFDARGYCKTLTGTRTREGLALHWQQACFERSKFAQPYDIGWTTFASPDKTRPADWRDAADLYKQWAVRQPWCARKFADRDDLPAWLKQGPAMVRFGREWLTQPERIERWLRTCWPEYAQGVPLVIAYWGWEKHGSWVTPDYFPVFPSDEQFARLVRVGRECGGHAFLWPSGYHYTLTYQKQADGTFQWDDRKRFFTEAVSHAIHTRDGKPLIGDRFWLGGGQTSTMCPGDPWTIDWFNRTAVECVKRGAELVQVDQVVGGSFPVCYRTAHGHPAGAGLWMSDAFFHQLETMRAACRRIDPQAVVCVEEPNEWFLHQVGIQDYRDWEVMRRGDAEPASVFNYVYHEYLPTFQSNPRLGDRLALAHCVVTGQMPHLTPWPHFEPGPALVDGGLEEYGPTNTRGWDKVNGYHGRAYSGRATRDTTVRHGGQASLRLETTHGEIVQVSQNVPLGEHFQVGHKYRLSAWIKTGELAQRNAIGLAALCGGVKSAGSWHIPLPKPGDWTRGQVEFTLPEGALMLRIMLHVNGHARLWIDDVRLEEVLPDGRTVEVQRSRRSPEQRAMQQWIALYHGRGRPWLQFGRTLHPPRLDCATFEREGRRFAVVQHNAFAAADGSEAVILANATDRPQTATLTWHGKTMRLELASEEIRLLPDAK